MVDDVNLSLSVKEREKIGREKSEKQYSYVLFNTDIIFKRFKNMHFFIHFGFVT